MQAFNGGLRKICTLIELNARALLFSAILQSFTLAGGIGISANDDYT
jgi:hypothetical protein